MSKLVSIWIVGTTSWKNFKNRRRAKCGPTTAPLSSSMDSVSYFKIFACLHGCILAFIMKIIYITDLFPVQGWLSIVTV